MTIKTTSDHAAMVDTEFNWIPVARHEPPLGTKILAIDNRYGVAVITLWSRKSEWTHWAPLPTFSKQHATETNSVV